MFLELYQIYLKIVYIKDWLLTWKSIIYEGVNYSIYIIPPPSKVNVGTSVTVKTKNPLDIKSFFKNWIALVLPAQGPPVIQIL
jgi:hypothetical protein